MRQELEAVVNSPELARGSVRCHPESKCRTWEGSEADRLQSAGRGRCVHRGAGRQPSDGYSKW